MTIDELITLLTTRFPNSFNERNYDEMELAYRHALAPFPQKDLERAYDQVMGTWQYNWAPTPAHFLAAMGPLPVKPNPITGKPQSKPGENMKVMHEIYRHIKPNVIAEWLLANSENLQAFQAQFYSEEDVAYGRSVVLREIEARAHDVAMRRARGHQAEIKWDEADWQAMARRVRSQRPHARETRGYTTTQRELINQTAAQLQENLDAPNSGAADTTDGGGGSG